jgi:polyisoprenoid-binding protein YceI
MLVCAGIGVAFSQSNTPATIVTVQGGTASFIANTNVPALSVKGKSNALEGQVSLRRDADGLHLEHIEARLPAKTLVTGMALRDDHMRKYIFTTQDGQMPDLKFEASNAACTIAGRDTTCEVLGTLSIRGIARPFAVPLKIREDGGGYKAAGDAEVALSAYGIERPSQLGVQTKDGVQLHFEFTAKRVTTSAAVSGGH